MVAGWHGWLPARDSLPVWAWDDEAVALAAVKAVDRTVAFVSEGLRSSNSFMLDAVTRNGHALKSASVELRSDEALVLAAVTNNSFSLQYASDNLKADRR